MNETGKNLYFEDVFEPKGFNTPSTMRIVGMSTRSKFFHPNDITIRISVSLRQEVTHADGNYSYGDASNQFGNSVTSPMDITRGLRIGILNNDNYANLMAIDILNTSPAARSYMNTLRKFILGQ
ncbi:hypothetical protein C900_00511 [Fulvivirga imtechensis AK7]|uniref:Uncharacterized protein n=1 Tax=Fulvivirga imtechensis AK7 TaxID=1237149 RepID=L8JHQ2_9BACT|nr:hypothetical protein [Fulvivirga imtechensis]ELR68340.1 hypothetical protein C900_00511 [Fulvivirga imtechensis AK7]